MLGAQVAGARGRSPERASRAAAGPVECAQLARPPPSANDSRLHLLRARVAATPLARTSYTIYSGVSVARGVSLPRHLRVDRKPRKQRREPPTSRGLIHRIRTGIGAFRLKIGIGDCEPWAEEKSDAKMTGQKEECGLQTMPTATSGADLSRSRTRSFFETVRVHAECVFV